jgi:hypothetical protein
VLGQAQGGAPAQPGDRDAEVQLPSQPVVVAMVSATSTVRLVSPDDQPVEHVLHVPQGVRCPAAEQPQLAVLVDLQVDQARLQVGPTDDRGETAVDLGVASSRHPCRPERPASLRDDARAAALATLEPIRVDAGPRLVLLAELLAMLPPELAGQVAAELRAVGLDPSPPWPP